MATVDVVSTDWVASQIMGYRPSGVKFLKLAVKEKVGDPDGIVTVGQNPREFAQVFPKEGFVVSKYLWGYSVLVAECLPQSHRRCCSTYT
jgi:uncharacterized protein (DUF362 family)